MSFFIVVNTEFNRKNYPDLINKLYIDPPSYVMVKKIQPYRKHHCWNCSNEWIAMVVLSKKTNNISGEQTNWCTKCQTKASASSAWINHDGTDWKHESVFIPY